MPTRKSWTKIPHNNALGKRLVRTYRSILYRPGNGDENLTRSAIVFAPHPDDETLGCGGTMARKVGAGADVRVVVMTDGSRSHRRLMSADELKKLRANEVIAAVARLGIDEQRILLLNYENKELINNKKQAVEDVARILRKFTPEEVYIPYEGEAPADHFVTNEVVLAAVRSIEAPCIIFEYPIWFWAQWPFAGVPIRRRKDIPRLILETVNSNLRLLTQFKHRVFIGDVLDVKQAALAEHRTQMSRYLPTEQWPTLADVADGAFLECFFQNWEIFRLVSPSA